MKNETKFIFFSFASAINSTAPEMMASILFQLQLMMAQTLLWPMKVKTHLRLMITQILLWLMKVKTHLLFLMKVRNLPLYIIIVKIHSVNESSNSSSPAEHSQNSTSPADDSANSSSLPDENANSSSHNPLPKIPTTNAAMEQKEQHKIRTIPNNLIFNDYFRLSKSNGTVLKLRFAKGKRGHKFFEMSAKHDVYSLFFC
jgi:hypothetical protein